MRHRVAVMSLVLAGLLLSACDHSPVDPKQHEADVLAWRAARVKHLTAEEGWLTLVGLYWLRDGENTFGRAPNNALVLDEPQMPDVAGSFFLDANSVRFQARPDAGVTHDGQPVTSIELAPDSSGHPTELAIGSLRFYIIERAGHLGLRVRDLASPRRAAFKGLEYYPISTEWVRVARFHPYDPVKKIPIVNVLGMVEDMDSPGYLSFVKDRQEWHLDTVLEDPADTELFIMFADGTSGHGTYGAGRFMYVPMPKDDKVLLDFNEAYNPPCAFNEFATCPLPPSQNRLALTVTAGEKAYDGH